MAIEEMYRYVEEHFYEHDDTEYDRTEIRLLTYKVVKTTPCGVWITRTHFHPYLDHRAFGPLYHSIQAKTRKWVQTTPGRKRFAYPEKEKAFESFIERKEHHVWHSKYRLLLAESALAKGKEMLEKVPISLR